jgi:hypothetical protein
MTNLVKLSKKLPTSHSPLNGDKFNHPVDKLSPILTHFTTGHCFNKTVDMLPPTLATGGNFNQPVDKLSPTLTHLTTGYNFNQKVDNFHKHSHLTTGLCFNN